MASSDRGPLSRPCRRGRDRGSGLDASEAEQALATWCVVDAAGQADAVEQVASALDEMAPLLCLDMNAVCPECAAQQSLRFDIQEYLLRRLLAERSHLLADIHRLATAYGWSLESILALPRQDRRAFVSLIGDGSLSAKSERAVSSVSASGRACNRRCRTAGTNVPASAAVAAIDDPFERVIYDPPLYPSVARTASPRAPNTLEPVASQPAAPELTREAARSVLEPEVDAITPHAPPAPPRRDSPFSEARDLHPKRDAPTFPPIAEPMSVVRPAPEEGSQRAHSGTICRTSAARAHRNARDSRARDSS